MAQIENIMSIYYGANKKPYKDQDRQINYPIVGADTYIGENNTTRVRFFVDRIGGAQYTWLATIKKPDGSICFQILDGATLSDGYVDLDLADIYLDQQGAVYIGLTGYTSNDVSITQHDDTYIVNGNPQRICTGTVKIMVNYAPQILNIGTDISYSQYQQILAQLSKKLGLGQAIVFYGDITDIQSIEIQTSDLSNGQIAYDETTKWFYVWDETSEQFSPIALKGGKNIFGAIPVIESGMSTTVGELIAKGYDKSLFCVADSSGYNNYIYCIRGDFFIRLDIAEGGLQVGSATDTSKTITQAFSNPTSYYFETTSNKVNSLNDTTSTLKFPSNKATADYVKANAIESFTFDASTYQIKFFNGNGTQVGSTIDLPVESVVVNASYDNNTKKLTLTLANGNTIEISLADLVSGLVKTSDIADNLTTNDSTKVLSAKQGKVLNDTKRNIINSGGKVYITDALGNQSSLPWSYSIGLHEDSIPVRVGVNETVRVGTPVYNEDAVNKHYLEAVCEILANKTTSLSSSSTDTQYPSAKCVYDEIKKVMDKANGCTTSYLTMVYIDNSFMEGVVQDGYTYYYKNGDWVAFESVSEFNTWKTTKNVSINQDVFASTLEQLAFSNFLNGHYCVMYKDEKFYCLTIDDYDLFFKDGDNVFVLGDYFDRFYFSHTLEINNGGSPIINETTISSTTPSQSLNSLITYKCTNALDSLEITGLTVGTNDNNPTWQISFVAGGGFSVTLASGIDWKYGTPVFNQGDEYTIIIQKRVDSGYYAFLL